MAEILGAAFFAAGIRAFPAVPQEEGDMAFWQYLWQEVCGQPPVLLPVLLGACGGARHTAHMGEQGSWACGAPQGRGI